MARLFINNISFGLYWLHEDIDKEFLKSRYQYYNDSMYKCGASIGNLGYLGDKEEDYKRLNFSIPPFLLKLVYDKKNGDYSTFKDLVDFIRILNKTSDIEFENEIVKFINVDKFIRQLIVEISIMVKKNFIKKRMLIHIQFGVIII
jgi:spore coat protein CotH